MGGRQGVVAACGPESFRISTATAVKSPASIAAFQSLGFASSDA